MINCTKCTKWKTCEHGRKAHPRDGITSVSYYIDECNKYVPVRHYYMYGGYDDGYGRPHGYVIKCYSDEEYEHYTKDCRHVLLKIEDSYDNTDYLHDPWILYNPHYVRRKPLSEGTFWGIPEEELKRLRELYENRGI